MRSALWLAAAAVQGVLILVVVWVPAYLLRENDPENWIGFGGSMSIVFGGFALMQGMLYSIAVATRGLLPEESGELVD